jgi:hypothetical protein
MIALRLEFLFMKIGKTGRSIFDLYQKPAAWLALGNMLAHPGCLARWQFLVREEKKLLLR